MPKKIFIIACEPSGDTHAAHLVEKLFPGGKKKRENVIQFRIDYPEVFGLQRQAVIGSMAADAVEDI